MEAANGFQHFGMRRSVAACFALFILFNLFYNMTLPLHFDEAYYWVWSNQPQLSYFDHPPMIAWLISVTTLLGNAEWLIRLVPLGCATLTGLTIWRLAALMYTPAIADKALLIFLLSPLAQMGFTLATPDAPMILGWSLTLFCAYRAFFEQRCRWYYLAGLAAGFALLSKYTAVLLFPALFGLALCSSLRRKLMWREFAMAVGLALLVFLPVIIWNAGQDWVSFRFQLNHGFAGPQSPQAATFFEYFGVQAVAVGPLFFLFLLFRRFSLRFRLLLLGWLNVLRVNPRKHAIILEYLQRRIGQPVAGHGKITPKRVHLNTRCAVLIPAFGDFATKEQM